MATLPQWKRLPSLHYNIFDPRWGFEHDFPVGSTPRPKLGVGTARWPSVQKQIVVPEQSADDQSGESKLINNFRNRCFVLIFD